MQARGDAIGEGRRQDAIAGDAQQQGLGGEPLEGLLEGAAMAGDELAHGACLADEMAGLAGLGHGPCGIAQPRFGGIERARRGAGIEALVGPAAPEAGLEEARRQAVAQ